MLKFLRSSSQWVLLAICLASVFLYVFVISQSTFFISARLKTVDALYSLRSAHSEPSSHLKDIVIVGVDDESYQKMNLAWPWGRNVFADFLEHLEELNPKVVAMDFSFVGESSSPEEDERFAASLSKTKNVLLTAYFDQEDHYVLPLNAFRSAALDYGFVDKPLDHDLVNRHVNPAAVLENGNAYSLAFATAYASLGLSVKDHVRLGDEKIWISDVEIPLDHQMQMWLSYRYRPADFTYVPFWKIYENKADLSQIRGKTVIVGPISPLFHDVNETPLGTMAGVFVNANEVLAYMDADFIREFLPAWQWLFLAILAAAFSLVFNRLNYWQGFAVLIGFEALIYLSAFGLFSAQGLLLEPFSPMFILGTVYTISMFFRSLASFLETQALKEQVVMDDLTGLYSHRYLELRLEVEYRRHKELKKELCFVMVDIDHFKKVNDTYGHEHGNIVLAAVAKALKNGIRGHDVAARYGGEEFSLILSDCDEKAATQSIERIRKSVEALKFPINQSEMSVTISAGICSANHANVKSYQDLKRLADEALYKAKDEGRNRVCLYAGSTSKKLDSNIITP